MKAVLGQTADGRRILEKLEEDPRMLLEEEDRQLVVNQTVAELIRKSSFYPEAKEKIALADAIVKLFPSAAYKGLGVRESTQFYCEVSCKGFIQQRLKDARAANKARKRGPYKKKGANSAKIPRTGPRNSSAQAQGSISFDSIDDVKEKVWKFLNPFSF